MRVERRPFQYLYQDDMGYNFMNNQDFSQISLQEALINAPKLLLEGQTVEILFHAEKEMPLLCDLPATVIMKVMQSDPGIKGNTATNATKPATVESGAKVNVPLFINEGDKIKIDTATGNYLERVR